jgi:hypothetical protein
MMGEYNLMMRKRSRDLKEVNESGSKSYPLAVHGIIGVEKSSSATSDGVK